MCTVGPLPTDERGNKYIVVAIDSFSRFVEMKAAPDATAKSAAAFLLELFGRYGAPKTLRSDRGTQFTAHLVQQLLALCGAASRLTLSYRPQANGIVERVNAEVMRHLRAIVFDGRVESNWSLYLPIVQRILNSTVSSATGTTPCRVMFGGAVDLDRPILIDPPQSSIQDRAVYS